jgi:hypothetical protein
VLRNTAQTAPNTCRNHSSGKSRISLLHPGYLLGGVAVMSRHASN